MCKGDRMLHLINKRQLFITSMGQFFRCPKGCLGHMKDWIQSYPFIITGTFISYTLNAKTSSQKTKSKKHKKKKGWLQKSCSQIVR